MEVPGLRVEAKVDCTDEGLGCTLPQWHAGNASTPFLQQATSIPWNLRVLAAHLALFLLTTWPEEITSPCLSFFIGKTASTALTPQGRWEG